MLFTESVMPRGALFLPAAVLAIWAAPGASAEPGEANLTPFAVVVHNWVQSYVRRGGEPFVFGSDSPITDGKPPRARAVGKFADSNHVDLWFPYPEPVTVNRLRFNLGAGHQPVRHRVQSWDGEQWQTVVTVDESNPLGKDIRFTPVTTRGIRLRIDKTRSIGFNKQTIGQVAVYGSGAPAETAPAVDWTFTTKRELNVFALGDEIDVECKLGAPAGGTLSWEWLDWYLRPVAVGGECAFDGSSQSFNWQPDKQGPYFLRATLRRHGAIASQALFLVGVHGRAARDRAVPPEARRSSSIMTATTSAIRSAIRSAIGSAIGGSCGMPVKTDRKPELEAPVTTSNRFLLSDF